MSINLQNICQEVCSLSKEVGAFIKNERVQFSSNRIEVKGKNDFVSYVDKTSEIKIIEGLSSLLPDSGFIAEEGTSTKKGEVYNWIIDPLDGTTNFIHGIPCYSISIALMRNTELVLGVIYEINLDECFYAWEGSKAYLNGTEINVSTVAKLKDSLIATGFPYYDYDRLTEYMESFKYFMKNTHGLRRLGSAATDLAYVACGRFDGFYDFNGKDNYLFGREIIAGNSLFFDEFADVIKQHFK
jgi:myo-inositol-1(or 4)-monophosphatase